MFKWIFAAQGLLYLVIMPWLRQEMEPGYYPPIAAGVIAFASLAGGYFGLSMWGRRYVTPPLSATIVEPRKYLFLVIVLMAIAYVYVSVSYGLLNRRLGSEYMAIVYSKLPLPSLVVLRVYEILFIPITVLYIYSTGDQLRFQKLIVIIALIISLPFMGMFDSRGRLLTLAIYALSFVKVDAFLGFFRRNTKIYFGGLAVGGVFVYMNFQRSARYNAFSDYLFYEVYRRMDGLNLVTELKSYGLLPSWGTYDLKLFDPLISKIPFLEVAQAAKAMGRTSTKQFYTQDLLKTNRFDEVNSMITDPLYFAGMLGVVVSFAVLGLVIARFDRFIKDDRLFTNRVSTVLAISFVTTFGMIEADFLGALTSLVLSCTILGGFMIIGCKRVPRKRVGRLPRSTHRKRGLGVLARRA